MANQENAQIEVRVSQIRDEKSDKDLAPLVMLSEDVFVFLADDDWMNRPVVAL